MLKKAASIFTYILLFITVVAVTYNEGCLFAPRETTELRAIASIDQTQLRAITSDRKPSERRFLSFVYSGFSLPEYLPETDRYLVCETNLDFVEATQNIPCETRKFFADGIETILAYTKDSYRVYSFETTTLPMLFLETGRTDAQPVGDNESAGVLTVIENNAQGVQQYAANFKKRGGTSSLFPKSAILIKLMDTRGAAVSDSILGLNSNTEFALNSLYDDDTKIRDIVSLSLWETMSKSNLAEAPNYGFEFVFTEIFINGTYAGLYGFQENVNLASFDLANQENTSIFKVSSHVLNQTTQENAEAKEWGDVALKETTGGDAWTFFEEAYALMFHRESGSDAEQVFDIFERENCMNYIIWCNLLAAEDNLWKNTVLVADLSDPAQGKMTIVPWDADLTLGARFNNQMKFNTEFNEENAEREIGVNGKTLYGSLWGEGSAAFQADTARRWFELRKNVLSEQTLLSQVDAEFDLLSDSGARRRDALRWPDSSQCSENDLIDHFISRRLVLLDEFYKAYLPQQG